MFTILRDHTWMQTAINNCEKRNSNSGENLFE